MKEEAMIFHRIIKAVKTVEDKHTVDFALMHHGSNLRKCPPHSPRVHHLVLETVAHLFCFDSLVAPAPRFA